MASDLNLKNCPFSSQGSIILSSLLESYIHSPIDLDAAYLAFNSCDDRGKNYMFMRILAAYDCCRLFIQNDLDAVSE